MVWNIERRTKLKAIKFKECNVTYAKNQPEYLNLPGLSMPDGELITCWELSIAECLKLLRTRKIWLSILTFNNPLQPLKMDVDKPFYVQHKEN